MNVIYAKIVIFVAGVAMAAIRAPHGQRSRSMKTVIDRKGALEQAVLTIAWMAFFVPLLWIVTPWLAFANYPLHPLPFAAGTVLLIYSLYLFHRSHVDLGTNWSVTLEIRETHSLVTQGLYRHVRHPMYLSLLLYGVGQALAVPNWIAGPSYFAAMALVFGSRLKPEEQLMRERFPNEYDRYVAETKRLIPGVW